MLSLKNIRKLLGVTQVELSKEMKVSQKSISVYENHSYKLVGVSGHTKSTKGVFKIRDILKSLFILNYGDYAELVIFNIETKQTKIEVLNFEKVVSRLSRVNAYIHRVFLRRCKKSNIPK